MIFETYAWRKRKALKAGEPEVFTYDEISPQLRHQICMAIHEGVGYYHQAGLYDVSHVYSANEHWSGIDRVCLKEIFKYLDCLHEKDLSQRFLNFLTTAEDVDDFLSAVEIACRILSVVDSARPENRGAKISGAKAIEEINARFLQHAVGFSYENQYIIRVDSRFSHAEIIRPTIKLLSNKAFSAVETEFMTAHAHYRVGSYKDAVTAANRAYESMLKTICDARGWTYGKGDRARELVTLVNSKGLLSHQFDKSITPFVAMMKTGLPSVRNDAGAHGDGLKAAEVTAQIARFAINLSAANILFFAEVAKLK